MEIYLKLKKLYQSIKKRLKHLHTSNIYNECMYVYIDIRKLLIFP